MAYRGVNSMVENQDKPVPQEDYNELISTPDK